jgi:sugar lactone lactonase YvrE
MAAWGANTFAMPHGLAVDRADNVWLTDVALHQVYKFTHDGRMLLKLGERGVPGDDSAHFNRPTDVAIAADGSFYVSDGYENSRIIKFAADGRFLLQWGTKGTQAGQFDLPHGVALDARGRVYVADRSNARVQIFDGNGRYLTEWKGTPYGRPFDVAIARDGTAFIADGGDIPQDEPDRSAIVVVRPDGTVIERFGRYGFYEAIDYTPERLPVGKLVGIQRNYAFHGRKPQAPVVAAPAGRLIAVGTFQRRQSVLPSIRDKIHRAGFAIGACVQCRLGDAANSLVRAKPEASLFVLENLADDFYLQLLRGDARKFSVLEPK